MLVDRLNGGLSSAPTLAAGGRALTMSPFDRVRLDAFLIESSLIDGQSLRSAKLFQARRG